MRSTSPTSAARLRDLRTELRSHADPRKAETHRGFFKNCRDDIFLGVTAPVIRTLAQIHSTLPLNIVRRLVHSRVHDEGSLGRAILVLKFVRGDEREKKKIYRFYLAERGTIRDWDGVDDSAPHIVGGYLMERDRALLYRLIRSRSLWDRRIALVATLHFIRRGDLTDTYRLTRNVLNDREDLIHKAAGWMLREAGKRDPRRLRAFLRSNYPKLPRTTLRYAIERFSPQERKRWLAGPV